MRTLPRLDFAEHLESFLRLRIARNVLYIHLLCAGATYSQRTASSFGPTSDISLGYTPIGLVRFASPAAVAVLAQETATVYFYAVNADGTFLQTDLLTLSTHAREIVSDPDASSLGFSLLSNDGNVVIMVHRKGSTFATKQFQSEMLSQRLTYGDINSDRRRDVLLFGKKRTGITPLFKQKDGNYTTGPVIFPDLSISDLQCIDLNGDGITDLFVLDWLSNRIALFYGIGRGIFSEQVEVALAGEPSRIAISPISKDRTVQIAVTMPEERLVSMFRCNATGEIEPATTLKFAATPLQAEFADLNNDKLLDLIVTTEQAVSVVLSTSGMKTGGQTPFGAGEDIAASIITDLDGDNRNDLLVIDRASKRMMAYANSASPGSVRWPTTYGVGNTPKGVAAVDVNSDGLMDLIVANTRSSTLSILLNRGEGKLQGQQAIPVSDMPVSLRTLRSPSAREYTIMMSHENAEKLSIVKLADNITATGAFTLPTGSNPYIVITKQDSISGQLELLVQYSSPRDSSPSISQFRQISGGQFVERSLRYSIPGRITALTVDDYSASGRYELVFVTHDKAARQSTLSIAFPGGGFDFKTVKPLLTFSDSTASVRSILSGYVDNDQHKDLILIMPTPRSAFGVVYGRGGGTFRDSVELIRNVQLLNEDAFLLRDVDSDGHPDMTWIDTGRNAIVTMYGRGNRKFDPPMSIRSANHITAIQIASMKFPNIQDLIFANGSKGTISIFFDPFR